MKRSITIVVIASLIMILIAYSSIGSHKEIAVKSKPPTLTTVTIGTTTTTTTTTIPTTTTEPNYITFRCTAYCPCSSCCGKSDGITATGTKATEGRTIAVDPNYIPYGTEVIIDGHKYVAGDCGGVIKGNRIDIYFDSHQEALNFGVQYLQGVIVW